MGCMLLCDYFAMYLWEIQLQVIPGDYRFEIFMSAKIYDIILKYKYFTVTILMSKYVLSSSLKCLGFNSQLRLTKFPCFIISSLVCFLNSYSWHLVSDGHKNLPMVHHSIVIIK